MSFISLSYLTPLARTSINMLNRDSDSGHPFLIFYFREKAFNLLSLSIILAVGLSYMVFISEVYSLCNSLLRFLNTKRC